MPDMLDRPLYRHIWKELTREKRMVFMAGARRVGKTTLAEMIGQSYPNRVYVNWEIPEDRTRMIRNPAFFEETERRDESAPLVMFDEINRQRGWRRYLKGACDRVEGRYQFLAAGSSRLDQPQRRGDSLAGRYYLLHLWPFTQAELGRANLKAEAFFSNPQQVSMERHSELKALWHALAEQSGFPEPFLAGRKTSYRRWSRAYAEQLIREDIRDLTGVKGIGEMETLYHLLPAHVGRLLSVPALAQGLQVAYNTIRSWLAILQRFFAVLSLAPWSQGVPRAIREGQKIYLYDFPRVPDPEARFENMVALELYRAVSNWNETGYGRFSLHFIRTKDQQEVDFLLSDDGRPVLLVDARPQEQQPSAALLKFQAALRVPAVHLVQAAEGYRRVANDGHSVLVAPACQYLAGLP
jgi:predicted AAA+ superfamily ATPase